VQSIRSHMSGRLYAQQTHSRRYREHLRAAAVALIRRPADDDSGDEGPTVRDLMVVNLGPAWVDDSLYQLFGRCGGHGFVFGRGVSHR